MTSIHTEYGPSLGASNMTRTDCRDMYLDWTNNFLTLERFAEHYGIDCETANHVIVEGRRAHEFMVDHGIRK
jgi:hypothetical protein